MNELPLLNVEFIELTYKSYVQEHNISWDIKFKTFLNVNIPTI